MIDEVRRIVTEAVIPYAANWNEKRKRRGELGDHGKKKGSYRGSAKYVE